MSEDLKTKVEGWLDAHWDSINNRQVGTAIYDAKTWLAKVVDAGYATPTWPVKWCQGLGSRSIPFGCHYNL